MPKRSFLVTLLLALTPALSSGQVPLGPEFRVNAHTTGNQGGPAVAWRAGGDFVVAWHGEGEGDGYGVFTRRFSPAGVARTPGQTRLNDDTDSYERFPGIALDADGRAVAIWNDELGDFSDTEVFARPIDAAGTPAPAGFRVNTYTTGHQRGISVAMTGAGNFVVVWASEQDGSGTGIIGQRFGASGTPHLGEFRINSFATANQGGPSVAPLPGGGFVVVWASTGQDGSFEGVFGQRFGASGTPLGTEFRVNSWTTGAQQNAKVAADASGRFVVIWNTFSQGGSGDGLFGQRFDAAGGVLGGEFMITPMTTAFPNHPALAADPAGGFVAAWSKGSDVFARRYDAGGTPDGGEFSVNSATPDYRRYPAVAFRDAGEFVVVWQKLDSSTFLGDVFGRRFAPDLIFKDGFESGDMSAWSATDTDEGQMFVWTGLNSTGWGAWGETGSSPAIFVQDDSPRDEDRYRARFFLDPVNFDPGEAEGHRRARIFIVFEEGPSRRLAAVVLRRVDGAYSLLARARLDNGSQHDTAVIPITTEQHFIEVDWKRSSGPSANDGSFQLWLDGRSVHAATALDNSVSAVDFVRMGALSLKGGASGTLLLDEFESRRATYIGNARTRP